LASSASFTVAEYSLLAMALAICMANTLASSALASFAYNLATIAFLSFFTITYTPSIPQQPILFV
jgi:hypothetical protein